MRAPLKNPIFSLSLSCERNRIPKVCPRGGNEKKRTGKRRRNETVREKHNKSARENAHPSAAAAERGQAAEKSSSGW